MTSDTSIGLLFRIAAKDDGLDKQLQKYEKDVEAIAKDLNSASKTNFLNLSKNLDISAESTAKFQNSLTGLGDKLDISEQEMNKFGKGVLVFAEKIGISGKEMAHFGGTAAALAGPVGVAIGVVTALTAATVALGTVLFSLARETAEYAKEIDNFSKLTGFSVETVHALKIAAEKAGISLSEIEEVFESFVELMNEAGEGAEEAVKKVKFLGLDPQKAFNDLEGSFLKVFDKIKETTDQAGKAKVAMTGLGESGLPVIKMTENLTGGTKEYIKALKEQGVLMDAEGVRKSLEFANALGDLEKQTSSAAREFSIGFMPAITAAMRSISGELKGNKSVWQEWGESIGQAIFNAVQNTKLLIAVITDLSNKDYTFFRFRTQVEANAKAADKFDFDKLKSDNSRKANELGGPSDADLEKWFDRKPFKKDEKEGGEKSKSEKKEDPTKDWTLIKVLEAMRKGTMKQESDGQQGIQNPRTKATGLFQVLPGNIRDWTRDTFGKEMSVEEFKKDVSAQIAIFNKYMGAYLQRGLQLAKGNWEKAIRIAAVQWYGTGKGEGLGYDDPTIFQKGEPSRREYTKSVLSKTKKFLTGKDSNFATDQEETQNQIGEKLRQEAIKNRENQDTKILEIARQTANEDRAIYAQQLEQKLISVSIYRKNLEAIDQELLITERTILKERLKMTELFVEDRTKIESQILKLNSEIKVKQIEEETNQIKDQNEELEKQKQIIEGIATIRNQVIQSERDLLEFRADQERKILENESKSAKTKQAKKDAESVLEAFDIAREERRKQWILEDIDREKQASIEKLTNKEIELGRKEELEKLYENRRLIAIEESETKQKEIRDSYQSQSQGSSTVEKLFGGLLGQGETDVIKFMGDQITQSFNSMAQAAGNALAAFVKFGSAGGSFRKFAAEIIASLAQMAVVQAVWNVAEGFAKLAMALFGHPTAGPSAKMHFTAAAVYAGIAGVTAGIGRGIAGDSFKNTSNATAQQSGTNQSLANSSSSSSTDARTITEGRIQRQEQTRVLEMKVPQGWFEKHVIDDINSLGALRNTIVKIVEST